MGDDERPDIRAVFEALGGQVTKHNLYGWAPAKCPLHDDSNASAQLHEDKQVFRCHVCNVFGDVYELVMRAEGVGFRESKPRAVELAGDSGVAIPEGSRRGRARVPGRSGDRRERRGYIPPWARK